MTIPYSTRSLRRDSALFRWVGRRRIFKAAPVWLLAFSPRAMLAQQRSDTTGTAGVFGIIRDSGGRGLANTSVGITVVTNAADPSASPIVRRQTTTDEEGRYRLDALPSGIGVLEFRRVGYTPTLDTLALNAGMRWPFDVTLANAPPTLSTVTVEGQADKYHRRVGGLLRRFTSGKGTFITRAQIDSLDPTVTSDLLERRSGIYVLPGPSGTGKIEIPQPISDKNLYPPCPGIRYFINGIETPVDSMPQGLDTWSPDEIQTIEVYRYDYETPPEFRGIGRNCGAIAIWTRERDSKTTKSRTTKPQSKQPRTKQEDRGRPGSPADHI